MRAVAMDVRRPADSPLDDYDEDLEDEEVEEEWARAGQLAESESARKPKPRRRALSKDGSSIEVEHEKLGCSAYVHMFFLVLLAMVLYRELTRGFDRFWPDSQRDSNLPRPIVMVLVLWSFVMIEALCCSKTSQYLQHICCEESFERYVDRLQESDPDISFAIQNYHMETRTVTSAPDAQGKTTQHTEQVRVNTHHADRAYHVAAHLDETLSPKQMVALFHLLHGSGSIGETDAEDTSFTVNSTGEQVLILLCHFPIHFHPYNSRELVRYDSTRDNFWRSNTTDISQDKRTTHRLRFDAFTERMMVILSTSSSESTTRPMWMNYWAYALCSACLLSIPYRLFLFRSTVARTWDVTKHFTSNPQDLAQDPDESLKHSSDLLLSRVVRAGKGLIVRRKEEQGSDGGGEDFQELRYHSLAGGGEVEVDEEPPPYWNNKNLHTGFATKEKVSKATQELIRNLIMATFKDKATSDRQGEAPASLEVLSVSRVEDRDMWLSYARKRSELAESRGAFTAIQDLEGSGRAKTMAPFGGKPDAAMHEDMNEVYLFHGTSASGAMSIRDGGFRLSLSGSNAGTMFGRGVYFAEASSKADEYAETDASGIYTGVYAMLLCRVACGEPFRITKSNIPAIESALESGEYDCVLGDREAAVGTYREFVVFDEAQIYPEYVVLYRREFD